MKPDLSPTRTPEADPYPEADDPDRKTAKGRRYIVIPTYATLTPTERASVDDGGDWPARNSDYLPVHETFLDFLIDRGLNAWSRANGGGR